MRFALAVSLALLLLPAALSAQPAEPAAVSMAAVAGAGPIAAAELFAHAPPSEIVLLPQVVTTPKAPNPSISKITVRAVRNRDHAGFLLEWSDATQNARTAIDGFGDMVAIAFPVRKPDEPMPAPFMGNPKGRVQILQWRADWQTDLARGPLTVAELYPNAYAADFYHEDHLPPAAAAKYRGAAGAGNPMSERHTSSVQDLMAEGFGSLTPRSQQTARGSARHDAAGWHVVITRPLAGDGESSVPLVAGASTHLALAVWDGAQREVGSRKAWAPWLPLEVAK
jgi:DMSO reductase family type II enzyme heme b subunit